MDAAALIRSMERFPGTLAALVEGVTDADAAWRPSDDGWSIAEIVTHLADEEVVDFGARLRRTLEEPAADWDPIDPEGLAARRRAEGVSLTDALARFAQARAESLGWLHEVGGVDWSTTHEHPKFGAMRAGDLLAAWAAHDILHLRQIAKRLFQLVSERSGTYETRYAGEWTA